MEKEMFFDCTGRNVDPAIIRYFGSILGRTPDYNNFNIIAEEFYVTVFDGYSSQVVLKSDLPNKIARKIYL